MKRYFCVLQAFIFSLLFIGCSNEDESASTPTVQASKTELFAIGTARMTRAASSPYLSLHLTTSSLSTRRPVRLFFKILSRQVSSFPFTVI